MKAFSRRKFVRTAITGSVGITVMPKSGRGDENITPAGSQQVQNPGSQKSVHNSAQFGFNTMRPIREPKEIIVTVGQTEGDFQGIDDKILQAAVDYVHGLGGGRVQILPGTYTMRNSLFPRPGVIIQGSGKNTVLLKTSGISSKIIREADWYEYCVQVENPEGFTIGGGIALETNKPEYPAVLLYTITSIDRNILYINRRTEKNYWMMDEAFASTRFSIIHALNVDNVSMSDLVLDGNRTQNDNINGNYAGAVFMQYCNRWKFNNVISRNFNGDGFSFQVCDDIHFENCCAINNADLGFHPGSGSQRPVFIRCTSRGNSQGFFWCWGVCDGIAEDCISSNNDKYGINIGHRDTDNKVNNCLIENNGEVGIIFREEPNEFRTGDRNLIENCMIRNNGKDGSGFGIDIQWKTRDITVRNCTFENSSGNPQKIAVRISPEAQHIFLEGNKYKECSVEDQRIKSIKK